MRRWHLWVRYSLGCQFDAQSSSCFAILVAWLEDRSPAANAWRTVSGLSHLSSGVTKYMIRAKMVTAPMMTPA